MKPKLADSIKQETNDAIPDERFVMLDEAAILWQHHVGEADYYLACKQRNLEIANTEPLYTFGKTQTKADWLARAADFDKKRQFHRKRARHFLMHCEA